MPHTAASEVPCAHCGQKFIRPAKTAKFCQLACKRAARNARRQLAAKKRAEARTQRERVRHCDLCGAPFEANVVGRPRIYCERACADTAALLDAALDRAVQRVNRKGASLTARKDLRKRLWNTGNELIAVPTGRQPGTRYWVVRLACGHSAELRARWDGGPEPRRPKRTRCNDCRRGNHGGLVDITEMVLMRVK